jgi:hypothetical protein
MPPFIAADMSANQATEPTTEQSAYWSAYWSADLAASRDSYESPNESTIQPAHTADRTTVSTALNDTFGATDRAT